MKNITYILIILLFSFVKSEGQITKGNWLSGGNVHFTSIKNEYSIGTGSKQIGFSPVLGKFLFDKFAVGVKPSLLHGVYEDDYTKVVVNVYRFGPFLRYYFLSDEKPFNLLLEGSYQYAITKYSGFDFAQNVFSLNGGPIIFLNNVVGLEFLFGYSHAKTVGREIRREALEFSIGLQVHLE